MAKREHRFDVVVIGCGVAGLSAAVAARQRGVRVAVLERAPTEERGGNTRYTEAFLRMKSEDEVSDDFEAHFAANAGGYLDPSLVDETAKSHENWPSIVKALSFADPEIVGAFAAAAGPTIKWLKTSGISFDFQPTPFLTMCTPRLSPRGGGLAIVEGLAATAEKIGVEFFYETTANDLILDEDGEVAGVRATIKGSGPAAFLGRAIVLASGGYEGNPEMLAQYMGPRALYLRPIARGGYYNKGEGIRMALRIGAAPCGDFSSYHAEPIDPRSGVPEAAIFIFPYGILVNQEGRRFVDEAPATVDATYESITRQIFQQTEQHRLCDPRREARGRSEPPARDPHRSATDRGADHRGRWRPSSKSRTPRWKRRSRNTTPRAGPGRSSRSRSIIWRRKICRRRSRTGRARSTRRRTAPIRSSRPTCSRSAA